MGGSATKILTEEGNGVVFVPAICSMSLCFLILILGWYSERTRSELSEAGFLDDLMHDVHRAVFSR